MIRKRVYQIISIILIVFILSGCITVKDDPGVTVPDFEKDNLGQGFAEGNENFAFEIFRKLNKEDAQENVFISSFSISAVLSMIYNGAQGTTKEAMDEVLGYSDITLKEINESYQYLMSYLQDADPSVKLDIGNSIWIRDGFEVEKEFIERNETFYKALVENLDFNEEESISIINKWIDEATNGKITKMIDPPVNPLVIMYLVNAIYFKGEWTDKFDIKDTYKGTFNNLDAGKSEIDMMSRNGSVYYGDIEDAKVARLPYGEGKIVMYVVLPDAGVDVNEYIDGFTKDKWLEVRRSVSKRQAVTLEIPKFKIEYGIKNLNDSLIDLGMGEAFGEDADFSGIADDVLISRVLHKAVIETNEQGSEAAAVTVGEMQVTSMPVPTEFIADRPFMFLIVEEESNTILFTGKIVEM